MPTKRAILAELTRDELRTNVDYYELEVEDRRVKTQLVDALSRSRQASLDEILRAHSRFPGHALTPTGVMAIRCKQFHLPDL